MSLPQPVFGQPLPVRASRETLELLARRRSTSAPMLSAPGPTPEQVDELLRVAVRVPDHGKLSPWRFILLEGEAKAAYVAGLRRIAGEVGMADASLVKVSAPPLGVAVIFRPVAAKIPVWEQELSAGAVCMTLLIAAQAMGFGANWITDWYAVEPKAAAWLGLAPGESLAGFIYIGTSAEPPQERVRPDVAALISRWGAPA